MTDIKDNVYRYFATTVALITTKGSNYGPNVMAAEWTINVSYDPMLVAVFVHDSPTYWNMKKSRVFGVNIASDNQAELVNIAGGYSGTEIQKLAIPGIFEMYDAKHIDVPMIKGCALNAECEVNAIQIMGDHIMVIGKVVSATFDHDKFPLIYTRGNYRKLSRIKIPSGRKALQVTTDQMALLKEMSKGRFVLKVAAAVIRQRNKLLLQKTGNYWVLPMVAVERGANYMVELGKHLKSTGISAQVGSIRKLERMTLNDGRTELRANFITFGAAFRSLDGSNVVWFTKMPKNTLLRNLL